MAAGVIVGDRSTSRVQRRELIGGQGRELRREVGHRKTFGMIVVTSGASTPMRYKYEMSIAPPVT